jgi:hypothetical protein
MNQQRHEVSSSSSSSDTAAGDDEKIRQERLQLNDTIKAPIIHAMK